MQIVEIDPDKWYVVDLRKPAKAGHYKLVKREFDTKKATKEALERGLGDQALYFEVVKGSQAIEFGFKLSATFRAWQALVKYDYPPGRTTVQSRKSFRTKFRRWKRNYKRTLTTHWA